MNYILLSDANVASQDACSDESDSNRRMRTVFRINRGEKKNAIVKVYVPLVFSIVFSFRHNV